MMDLTKITTPFGLLDPETQEALKAHGGPYEVWTSGAKWRDEDRPGWSLIHTYRVKPEPLKPREFWIDLNHNAHSRPAKGLTTIHVREVIEE